MTRRDRIAARSAAENAVRCATVLLLVLVACAGGTASQRQAPTIPPTGKFTASVPPAAQYGPDPSRTCPSDSIINTVRDDIGGLATRAGKPAPEADGRLCGIAQALLGWDEKQPVPEQLLSFLAQHFGVAEPVRRVIVATVETDKPADISPMIQEAVAPFLQSAFGVVRYGFVTQRIRRGPLERTQIAQGTGAPSATKVSLVMQDSLLDLTPVPRKLDPNGQATLQAKLLDDLQNPAVLVSDVRGKLEQPPQQKGKDVSAALSCGGRTGRMVVEIRAEQAGSQKVVSDIAVLCGMDSPTSIDLGAGQGDPSQQEQAVFNSINRERTAAGLSPLTWDDRVAQVARQVSQSDAQVAAQGGGTVTSEQQLKQRLRDAGITSALVLQNPGEARTAEAAQDRFSMSPVHRANYMSSDATNGAVGVAPFTLQGTPLVMVTELFTRQLAAVDVASVRTKLREAIARNRTNARAGALQDDPALDKVAEEYAKELAAAGGTISNTRHSRLVSPLYRNYRTIDVVVGAKGDPLEFADEKAVLTSKDKALGIGMAQGNHPVLGQNAVYVVLLFGTHK